MTFLHIAFCLAILLSPVSATDTLWQRAVAISAYNRDQVPGNWIQREEVFNGEGESHLVSRTHVAFEQIRHTVELRLVEATGDGVDITEQLRESFDKMRSQFKMTPEYNPFQPANQKNVTAKPDGRSRRDGEDIFVAYDYNQKTESGRWRGTAWINDATGMAVEISARLMGLPAMDDKDRITETVLNVIFESGPEGAWYPVKIAHFKRVTLNNFPYTKFYATIETAITLDSYWKITFE